MSKRPGPRRGLVVVKPEIGLRSSKGETIARSESILTRRARAANFIADIARGASIAAVAEKYDVGLSTVQQDLRWAEREGFFDKADEAIRNRLIPLAIDVIEKGLKKALESGETDAAFKILMGVRLLSNGPSRSESLRQGNADIEEEMTWERFTARRATRLSHPDEYENETAPTEHAPRSSANPAPEDVPAIDAEILQPGDYEASASGEDAGKQPGTDGGVATDGDVR